MPAPNDTIYLVMRLYWPKDTPPSVLPAGEETWKPPVSCVEIALQRRRFDQSRREALFAARSQVAVHELNCHRPLAYR